MDLRATLGGKEMYPVRSVQSRGLANEVVANCIIEDLCVCVCVCVYARESCYCCCKLPKGILSASV